jgi:hypothetical protein
LVTLETVRLLEETAPDHMVTVESILLMAAAVPQGLCHPKDGVYRKRSTAARDRVLYSSSDKVLAYAFRLGQRAAELFDWTEVPLLLSRAYRRAVGREGGPEYRWDREPMLDFDHGDYWVSPKSHDEIASRMQRAPRVKATAPKARLLPTHAIGSRRPGAWQPPSLGTDVADWRGSTEAKWQ